MAVLHIVSAKDHPSPALDSCLRLIKRGSAIVLTRGAVRAVRKGADSSGSNRAQSAAHARVPGGSLSALPLKKRET